MKVEMVIDAKNKVGESIVWDNRKNELYWIDIIDQKIHSYDPATKEQMTWQTPDFVTSIGLRKDSGAIVGLKKQLTLWNFDGHFIPLAEIEPSSPDNRLNEGVVGPDGAYWVGTMQNNINADGTPKNITASTGRLYRCTADGSVVSVSEDKFGITNTFVWTDDGRLITADTLENALYSYRVNITGGALSDKKIILKDFDRGLPDGSCKDSEGYIWNCRVVGGSCVARVSAEGMVERVIELPCSWPTSCTFGGPDLKTLYVTSARFTMDSAHLVEFPHEGALMAVDTGFTGVLTNRFG